MKRGSHMSNFGSKDQRSTFRRLSGCTYFLTGCLTHLGQWSFLFCTQIQDDERMIPIKFQDKLTLLEVRKGRCPKALDGFADFSVLYQIGCFTYAFCYQFLVMFRCFGIFPLDCTGVFHLHNTRKQYPAGHANRSNRPAKSFASMNQVQIWHLSYYLSTSRTTFTRCKKVMLLHFIK